MSILVGYLPEREGRGALEYAALLARSTGEALTVATVVPRQWDAPSMARVDGEFAAYAAEVASLADRRSREILAEIAPTVAVRFRSVGGRSVSSALIRAAEEDGASMLVLGASADGTVGRVAVGSTADRLLHSSPLPIGIATHGFTAKTQRVTRLTFAFSGDAASREGVARARRLADSAGVPLRVTTFGIRMRTMLPSEIGLHAEDAVLEAWVEQAAAAQRELVDGGAIGPETETAVVTGAGWREALAATDWIDGEVFVLGSSPAGPVARVFLGSRATKLVRHAPVPVLLLDVGE